MRKPIDLSGKRFGRLMVIRPTDQRDGSAVVWECKCDCGRTVNVSARNLLHRGTISCGCYAEANRVKNLLDDPSGTLGQVENTNVSRIRSDRPQSNNKSGFRGVSWHKNNHGGGKWVAVIYFKMTRYRLGFYDTPEEAHKAYLEAKEKIHGPFIEWYESMKKP